jgi:hypothetical protein
VRGGWWRGAGDGFGCRSAHVTPLLSGFGSLSLGGQVRPGMKKARVLDARGLAHSPGGESAPR